MRSLTHCAPGKMIDQPQQKMIRGQCTKYSFELSSGSSPYLQHLHDRDFKKRLKSAPSYIRRKMLASHGKLLPHTYSFYNELIHSSHMIPLLLHLERVHCSTTNPCCVFCHIIPDEIKPIKSKPTNDNDSVDGIALPVHRSNSPEQDHSQVD
jgi:hypothetical protein